KKIFIIFLLLCLPIVLAKPIINDYVIDQANLLSPGTEQELRTMLQTLEEKTTTQFVIVTIQSLEGEPIEDYALSLAEGHIGTEKKDNGLLLLIALEDRAYRIEVGKGLEGTLNDAKAGRIARDYLVPAFQQENYDEGIKATTEQLILAVKGEYTEPFNNTLINSDRKIWIFVAIMIIILLFSIMNNFQRKKGGGFIWIGGPGIGRGWGGSGSGGFSGGGGSFGGGGGGGRW
ncbi:MAG: TPM domain-containing protein, partial [Nanoarchaeota archaeon]|nr:TPM domain-containing protein [Nanoarchaeota archaeon]